MHVLVPEHEREHIATVASGYGAFLHALHGQAPPDAVKIPIARVRGVSVRSALVRARSYLTFRMFVIAAVVGAIASLGLTL